MDPGAHAAGGPLLRPRRRSVAAARKGCQTCRGTPVRGRASSTRCMNSRRFSAWDAPSSPDPSPRPGGRARPGAERSGSRPPTLHSRPVSRSTGPPPRSDAPGASTGLPGRRNPGRDVSPRERNPRRRPASCHDVSPGAQGMHRRAATAPDRASGGQVGAGGARGHCHRRDSFTRRNDDAAGAPRPPTKRPAPNPTGNGREANCRVRSRPSPSPSCEVARGRNPGRDVSPLRMPRPAPRPRRAVPSARCRRRRPRTPRPSGTG